jgi:hypothetical protein
VSESQNHEGMMENELIPNYMYICSQLDTCHVEKYLGLLVPILRNLDKIISMIYTLININRIFLWV